MASESVGDGSDLVWKHCHRLAPWTLRVPHGLWQVLPPASGSNTVALAYVAAGPDGALPGVPLEIGTFSSAAEARLAVAMYEGDLPGTAAMAPITPYPDPAQEARLLAPGGIEFSLVSGPDWIALSVTAPDGWQLVGRLSRPDPANLPERGRPPGHEDP